jgi:phosphotriesterase-related protein
MPEGQIWTVAGPVRPDQAGLTLMHEHIISDISLPLDQPDRWRLAGRQIPKTDTEMKTWTSKVGLRNLGEIVHSPIDSRDNLRLTNEAAAIQELKRFKRAGGHTIVDLTVDDIKRDPAALRRISKASGVNIVMGTGFYRPAFRSSNVSGATAEALAGTMITDIRSGVGPEKVRAGIIGEIGAVNDEDGPLSAETVNIVKAAGLASKATGAAISLHDIGRYRSRGKAVDILLEQGVSPGRIVLGHATTAAHDEAYLRSQLERGIYVQFDFLGWPGSYRSDATDDRHTAGLIVRLVRAGFVRQLLLSHDVCRKTQLAAYGGNGYTYISRVFVPRLMEAGVTRQEIDQILINNPRAVLTFTKAAG